MKRLIALAFMLAVTILLSSAQAQEQTSPAIPAMPTASPPSSSFHASPAGCLRPTNQKYPNGAPVMISSNDCVASQDLSYNAHHPPVFPSQAIRDHHSGTVITIAHISKDGVPASVTIEKSSGYPELDEAAIVAIKQWRFNPASKNGVPIDGLARVPVNFELNLPAATQNH